MILHYGAKDTFLKLSFKFCFKMNFQGIHGFFLVRGVICLIHDLLNLIFRHKNWNSGVTLRPTGLMDP